VLGKERPDHISRVQHAANISGYFAIEEKPRQAAEFALVFFKLLLTTQSWI